MDKNEPPRLFVEADRITLYSSEDGNASQHEVTKSVGEV